MKGAKLCKIQNKAMCICCNVAKCAHEIGRNQITPFWIQVMFSVFRGPKYGDIRPNHTKKIQKRPKNHKIALHCTAATF